MDKMREQVAEIIGRSYNTDCGVFMKPLNEIADDVLALFDISKVEVEEECASLLIKQRQQLTKESDDLILELKRVRNSAASEVDLLRRVARLIYYRRTMTSGSLEMDECDALCKEAGLRVWEWPLESKEGG